MPSDYGTERVPPIDRQNPEPDAREALFAQFMYETMQPRQDKPLAAPKPAQMDAEFLRLFAERYSVSPNGKPLPVDRAAGVLPGLDLPPRVAKQVDRAALINDLLSKPILKPAQELPLVFARPAGNSKEVDKALLKRNENISETFGKIVENTLEAMPLSVKKLLLTAGYSVVASDTITEALPHLRFNRPRGWPPEMTWDNADGMQSFEKKTIAVAERRMNKESFEKSERSAGVLRHEIGHAVDQILVPGSEFFCDTADFKAAYDRDLTNIKKEDRERLPYHLQSGHAGRSETFADVFALLMGGPCNEIDAEPLKRSFPEVAKLIQTKITVLEKQQREQSLNRSIVTK